MTQEEIIELAKQAGFERLGHDDYDYVCYPDDIESFAKLVAKRTWVGLMDEEIDQGLLRTKYAMQTAGAWRDGVEWATKQLQERNT